MWLERPHHIKVLGEVRGNGGPGHSDNRPWALCKRQKANEGQPVPRANLLSRGCAISCWPGTQEAATRGQSAAGGGHWGRGGTRSSLLLLSGGRCWAYFLYLR